MKLYIDTSNRERITVGINNKRFETNSKEKSSQTLLPFIDRLLIAEDIDINDITEIEVNTGPGSFTGLRIGIAVANTLGFVLKVPVNGKKEELEINY